MKIRRVLAVSFLSLSLPTAAPALPQGGTIGQYTPPRTWPQTSHGFDLIHQKIAVAFDEAQRLVTGEVTTTVIPDSETSSITLDAADISFDGAADARGRRLQYDADASKVTVHLRGRAAAGDTVVFVLTYHAHPERGLYFVPRRHVIWSQGEATETRSWIPTYDSANDKTTWEFLVTANAGMKVLSNGTLLSVTPTKDGTGNVWHWSQSEPASTYLYSVVVGPFSILHDHWRDKPVEYWVYPDTTQAGWRTFGETPSMIELYSRLTGVPFPWDKYDQSAIPDFTYGGMENVSATTQTDGALHGAGEEPEGSGRSLVAHELAHQWFGDYTTTANWANAWLNEGLTTYMESVQNEKTRGWDTAQLEWWGQQQQAMQADRRGPRPLVWGEYRGDDPITLFFSGHVYPKGAQVAHQLRRLLGDETFWAGMHRFLMDNAHQPVTTKDLAEAFEKASQRDLDWFFDQWVYGIGYPQIEVSRSWDEQAKVLRITVDQAQPTDDEHPLFRFPVTLRVTTPGDVVRNEIMVEAKKEQTFDMSLPGTPLSFRFDEGGWLLGTVHTDQTTSELADMARHDLDTAARNWALWALSDSQDSTAVAARQFMVLNEREADLRIEALRQLSRNEPAEGSRAIILSALRDPDSGVRTQALQSASQIQGDAMLSTALTMYRHDPNVGVRNAALGIYARGAGPDAQDLLVEAAAPGHPESTRMTAARALARLHTGPAREALDRLTDPIETRGMRGAALTGLAGSGDEAIATAAAGRAVRDYDPLYAVQGARMLGRIGTDGARQILNQALASETRTTVREAIQQALRGR